jgi:hypothetical protein
MDADWTVERHLQGNRPEVIALYQRSIEIAQACGPFTYAVFKTAITLKGARRGFAEATMAQRALRGYLDLQRRVEDARITRSAPYTKRLYVHHFRVDHLGQLDEQFAALAAPGCGLRSDSASLAGGLVEDYRRGDRGVEGACRAGDRDAGDDVAGLSPGCAEAGCLVPDD